MSQQAAPPELDTELRREWRAPFGVDVRLTLSVHRHGGRDPAYRIDPAGAVWRTSLTPDGPGTLRLVSRPVAEGTLVSGQAWGPGAAWLLDTLPAQLGAHDDLSGFTARHAVVGELVLRYQGLRIGRTARVFEALVPAVLEQKVLGREAHRAWRFLLGRYGMPAPGPAPAGMRVVPPASTWARIPSWDWHRAGVEGVRARTIISAAAVAARLEQASELDPAEADRLGQVVVTDRDRVRVARGPLPDLGRGPGPDAGQGPQAAVGLGRVELRDLLEPGRDFGGGDDGAGADALGPGPVPVPGRDARPG